MVYGKGCVTELQEEDSLNPFFALSMLLLDQEPKEFQFQSLNTEVEGPYLTKLPFLNASFMAWGQSGY